MFTRPGANMKGETGSRYRFASRRPTRYKTGDTCLSIGESRRNKVEREDREKNKDESAKWK